MSSQRILVGIILVRRSGVHETVRALGRADPDRDRRSECSDAPTGGYSGPSRDTVRASERSDGEVRSEDDVSATQPCDHVAKSSGWRDDYRLNGVKLCLK